jgi:membrane protein DedA with SNARE-associated domain
MPVQAWAGAPVQPAVVTARWLPVGVATAGIAMAVAIAVGAVGVPDLAGAASDATRTLGAWVYLAVVLLIFLETTALVGFVIHGELALLAGGVAAERGDVSLAAVVALAWAAAVAGDLVSFHLGRRLGRPFLERHAGRFRLGPEPAARVDGFFDRHGGKALLLGRFTGFLRATMPFVAGSSDMPALRLLRFGVVSAFVWTTTFTLLGYAFSDSFARAGDTASRITLVAVLIVTAAFVLYGRRARRRASRPGP